MFERLFCYKFHIIPIFNPFINYKISKIGNYNGISDEIKDAPVIVSLTSIKDRFDDLPKTIYSLLTQSRKPNKLILWLSDSLSLTKLPYDITKFIKNGLDIRFVKDIGPYTKAIYALKEYNNAIIVTADDDLYYPKDWLDKLYMSYLAHPEDIHCHRVHKVKCENNQVLPYKKWDKHINKESASFDNFLTGAGGVLYPPNCFSNEVFREDIFLNNSPTADDIWFWIMALLNERKIRLIKDHNKKLLSTSITTQLFGKTLYSDNKKGKNDEQLNKLMKYYGENIIPKLNKSE